MTHKKKLKLKDMIDERERHTLFHRRNSILFPDQPSYKYFSTSKDGLFETYVCQVCGAAVTVPVGKA